MTQKRLIIVLLAQWMLIFGASAQSSRIVCDETCKIEYATPQPPTQQTSTTQPLSPNTATPVATASSEAGYAVVSPIGYSTVPMIQQAPRLTTLAGKTIALVGGSFMATITHPELTRLLEQHYPTARVLLFEEVGAAGVYPAPGVVRRSKEEFQEALRRKKVDAVISGNCGCGLCTPKEVGSCIAAEYLGIPAVAIAAPGFVEQVLYTARNNGVGAPRIAIYPGAFATHTQEMLIKNTREVLWPRLVEALTTPLRAEEFPTAKQQGLEGMRDDVFYGTLEEVNAYFREMNQSDGLPVTPPTFERVEAFLRYTDLAWNETVAVLPVAHRNTTVWHVAVNGVMAGCPPEYMPILIALTKAMGAPAFRRTLASTHAWIPWCWLNGPVARQLGIDCGQGAISEQANVVIGRFLNLAMMNLAGYYVGQNRMGTFGYPMPWCLVEDEAACREVGWKPYHVRQGYHANDNTITATSSLLWGNNMAPSTTQPQRLMELLAWDIAERGQFALGSGKPLTSRTLLMTKPIASILASKYRTPEQLDRALVRTARRPLHERVLANYYANPGSAPEERHNLQRWQGHLTRSEGASLTAPPVWHDTPETEIMTVATMQEGMTAYLITGDESCNKVQTMPGGGFETIRIELPKAWDRLMAEAGYRPLSEFEIH
ncbi:MAG: hypothetical protein IJW80_01590, partial [Alistipes sp.]|nr:hypothetical protein [Alistipes sp.]